METQSSNLGLDDQLCFALYAATNAVVRAYRPLLAEIGLTYPQYLLMLVLWQDDNQAVHELADRLALPSHAISPMLDRLEAAGLLARRRDPPDRRVVHVRLTQAGADLRTAASRVQTRVACATRLTPAALAALRGDLHALTRGMAEPAVPAPGPAELSPVPPLLDSGPRPHRTVDDRLPPDLTLRRRRTR